MTNCINCKYFTGNAIWYNGKNYLCCAIDGLIPEDVAINEDLDCDLYVENICNDNADNGSE